MLYGHERRVFLGTHLDVVGAAALDLQAKYLARVPRLLCPHLFVRKIFAKKNLRARWLPFRLWYALICLLLASFVLHHFRVLRVLMMQLRVVVIMVAPE